MCIGINQPIAPGSVAGSIDEDCLFLSVYTPAGSTPDSSLPVWVFIQGGGYAVDANSNLNGTAVVAEGQDTVFVQFNYRVGSFGFLASESIRENSDLNVGLLDQRKALEWIKQYINLVRHPSLLSTAVFPHTNTFSLAVIRTMWLSTVHRLAVAQLPTT